MANALNNLFTDIADAIRSKTGETDTMKPTDFPTKIEGISSGSAGGGGIDTSDENMQNFAFNFVAKANGSPELVLRGVLYESLYQATGSYDVTVPETLAGFDVTLGKA